MFEEARVGVLAYMAYHDQNPEAAWAAYVDMGNTDPVLLGITEEAKTRQLENIMTRIGEVVAGCKSKAGTGCRAGPAGNHSRLDRVHFEVCRQRIIDPTTDAERLADSCAHTLLDAIARYRNPGDAAHAMATARHVPQ